MTNEILVAILSLAGTAIGTFGGIVTSAKLTNYRLQQLEKKVDKHNQFAERLPVLEEKIKAASSRISNLEMAVGLAKTKI
jgi:hypothetical protein